MQLFKLDYLQLRKANFGYLHFWNAKVLNTFEVVKQIAWKSFLARNRSEKQIIVTQTLKQMFERMLNLAFFHLFQNFPDLLLFFSKYMSSSQ